MNIRSNDVTLASILGEDVTYLVADFQREYTWKTPEQKELVYDYTKFLKNNKDLTTNSFFLGTIITHPDNQSVQIVDGQQRLLTIAILLVTIRDISCEYIQKKSIPKATIQNLNHLASDINLDLSFNTNSNLQYNILPNQSYGQKFFESVLYEKNLEDNLVGISEKSLNSVYLNNNSYNTSYTNAYRTLKNTLEEVLSSQKTYNDKYDWLSSLRTAIKKTAIIKLSATDEESAYQLFADINFKGKPLTPIDLVKNVMLQKIRSKSEPTKKRVVEQWSNILNQVNQNNEIEFIDFYKYSWFILFPKNANIVSINEERNLYDLFDQEFKNGTSASKIEEFLVNLNTFYTHFYNLSHPNTIKEWKSNDWPYYSDQLSNVLNVSKDKYWVYFIFLVIPVYRKWLHKDLKGDQFKKVLEFINDTAFVYYTVKESGPSEQFIKDYRATINEIFLIMIDIKKNINQKFQNSQEKYSNLTDMYKDEIINSLKNLKYGNNISESMERLTKYFLNRSTGTKLINHRVTIEHILDKENDSEANKIGNLINLEHHLNDECDRKKKEMKKAGTIFTPRHKKDIYDRSSLPEVQNFISHYQLDTFDLKVIDQRSKEMATSFFDDFLA